ncbi:UDP-N-acetylglucosamine--N-acetylmuramyl-(pentapeptide) pyrophosphoryl-undecaprenol N-acetylglucosamine transferase [Planctomycetales bacterium ZRK34]|nr:UDP-N-acetylglucosamine--N-acetylmuramyl-(pentapeptide) pyrophosphoryl-undecaprenol N-acetylglucosamine transferase [Planctomycetales bacterium ZRK34]
MYEASGSVTVLFAGGGTGGHLFPSMAIAERLGDDPQPPAVHFVCSDRPLDGRILSEAQLGYTPSPVKPLPTKLPQVPGFLKSVWAARRQAKRLIKQMDVAVVVAMGGFVCGPVVSAATALKIPAVLVNLDAIPGKANRWLAKSCQQVYSVYDTDVIGYGRQVALPLRRQCVGPNDPTEARRLLGLDPDKPMLLVTGASQGATSINKAMIELASREAFRAVMSGWQILHLAGEGNDAPVREAYQQAGLADAHVQAFSNQMGDAWAGADLAISRSGAGSVAEAVANRCPSVFLPYPYHKDQHQRHNAKPIADAGGCIILDDAIEPAPNADRLIGPLCDLLSDPDRRSSMRQALEPLSHADGAADLAADLLRMLHRSR